MTTIRYKIVRPDGPPVTAPDYKTAGSSGMDLHALEGRFLSPGSTWLFPLGFAIELPLGLEAQIRPRSSLSAQGIVCHLGTIDRDYRGELAAVLTNVGAGMVEVKPGDRIAQLVIAPVERVTLIEADELSATVRGAGAFGSTGR